ncbi:hypothetical protein FGG08_007592 [Glutinoglossum americanum]|uniref:Type III pantothenate kinase n=1 Tax=Glutinoglossum americanum TaxID=1670608 RepID=A0A9P8HYY1_9PEZI|nr:hypothetical protein FGG08_007592 [Glutinoglossum americanum]
MPDDEPATMEALLDEFHPQRSILSSVIVHNPAIEALLAARTDFHKLSHLTKLPFTTPVGKPETIGADRLALCAAAVLLFPQKNNLVVALGTCITYNFINTFHEFLGGGISPGMDMRFKSLNTFTAFLPVIKEDWNFPLAGYDTRTNILSGVLLGMAKEIDGFVEAYAERYSNFNVLLTGGNCAHFDSMLSANTTGKINHYYAWAVLLAVMTVFAACENDDKAVEQFNKKTTALEEGHQIEGYMSQGGKTKAKLTSPLMYTYSADTSYVEFPKTLHVDFFNDTLIKESQVDARYGKYFQSQNKIFLRDSVVAMNIITHDTLKTDELWWDQNTQKFYTNKPVDIHKKDGTIIHGQDGMEAPQNFSSYVIYNSTGRGIVPKEAQDTTPLPPPSPAADTAHGQLKGIKPFNADSTHRLQKMTLKKAGT